MASIKLSFSETRQRGAPGERFKRIIVKPIDGLS